MASHWCSHSDVLRPSQSSDMLNQGTVVEKAHESEKTAMEVQVKKEKAENENQGGCDVSRPNLFSETSYRGLNRLLEETNLANIKEERKGIQSHPFDDPKCATEAGATEDGSQGNEKTNANTRKNDGARGDGRIQVTSETSSQNKKEVSLTPSDGNMTKKRTLYELYAEELSLQKDLGKLNSNHARTLEVPWHQDREREREHTEKIAYAQYVNPPYTDALPKRMGIREKQPDYRLDGLACKPGSILSDQIHESTAYLPLVDPRHRKFFITEEPRTRYFPGDQTYRSLQEELLPRAWRPKYGVMFADSASSECYSKNETKRINHSKEDVGSQSKERFERRCRLQADSYWPYLGRSAGVDDSYDNQRIAFLRVEHPVSEQRSHQSKTYHGYSTEQRPGSTPSTEEYVKYVPVPNSMLIPTQNSDYVINGRHDILYDMGYQFPVAGKGSYKDKMFYPCCNEEIPAIHYDSIASKARWFNTRNAERQRFDAIQALKAGVAFSGSSQPQTLFLNDVGIKGKSNKRERFKDAPFPVSTPRMHQESLSEEAVPERFARRIDGNGGPSAPVPFATDNYKGDKVSERNANGETTSIIWQQKVNGSRISKEMMGSKTWETSKEERIDLLKNKDSEESGNKSVDMDQAGTEGTKELQDPKMRSQEEAKQNQDDHSTKKISCSVCKKTFNRTSNLYTHMRTHSANKPHACEFCGKRFHQKADLRIHRYIHTGEKPHKCTKCGRGFKQLTHLKYHMRTHSDVRMYKCPYCEKGFNQKSNLQAHIFGHTGQRPHKCETCGKGFTLASTLNTHKRTHLPNKPFKCEFCDRAFYQKNALKMHYVSTHPYSSGACLV